MHILYQLRCNNSLDDEWILKPVLFSVFQVLIIILKWTVKWRIHQANFVQISWQCILSKFHAGSQRTDNVPLCSVCHCPCMEEVHQGNHQCLSPDHRCSHYLPSQHYTAKTKWRDFVDSILWVFESKTAVLRKEFGTKFILSVYNYYVITLKLII